MTRATMVPEQWVRSFVELYLEVEAGLRPARHIRPLLSPDLQPTVGNCGRQGRTPDVLTVRVQTRCDVCEAVVLLREGSFVSALAVSLRRDEHGWRITDVRRPEDPQRPDPVTPLRRPLVQTTWHEATPSHPTPGWQVPQGWLQPVERPQRAA